MLKLWVTLVSPHQLHHSCLQPPIQKSRLLADDIVNLLSEFHSSCVDSWLTKWGTFCPVCKFDMKTKFVYSEVSTQSPFLNCSVPWSIYEFICAFACLSAHEYVGGCFE